jgi:phage terminase large subunit
MGTLGISLPYKYTPRPYQLPFFEAMDSGIKRAVLVHHRRAGKDLACFNYMIKEAYREKGNYWYMFPEYAQARRAIWEGKTDTGFSYLDFIPKQIVSRVQKERLLIELKNGSLIRLVGSDADSLVGAGIKGIVLSEYSLIKPSVWAYIEPMIVEQKGWAVFNGTPRGENHFYHLYEMAKNNPRWFACLKSVKDTNAVPEELIQQSREDGTKTEEDIQQEYYCSFKGSISGAYYSEQFDKLDQEGRLTTIEYDPRLPVHTAWDIGVADATAIWFYQKHMNQIRIIDCYEATGEGLIHYIKMLQSKPYVYGDHWAPHDIKAREFGTGKTRLEHAQSLGIRFRVVRQIPVIDGINCVRSTLQRCWFDSRRCYDGIQALKQYRKKYDEARQCFDSRPLHDWSSHFADSFRYLCVSLDDEFDRDKTVRQTRAISDYIMRDNNAIVQHQQRNYLTSENSICLH